MAARDRAGVERRLVLAVGQRLRDEGVPGLGVNAIAREAGVDKVLVYRYFGGLDGLVRAWAATADFWPPIEEVLVEAELDAHDVPELGGRFVRRYVEALRARPATLQLLAWEMAADHPLLTVLEEAREAWAVALQARLAGFGLPPTFFALMNLHTAAVHYLLVRARRVAWYGGLPLQEPAGWDALYAAVEASLAGFRRGPTEPSEPAATDR